MDSVQHDYHVHSSYSDGSDIERMVERAVELGLDGVGFADHCLLSQPEKQRAHDYPMDVADLPERRAEIDRLRSAYDIRIFESWRSITTPTTRRQSASSSTTTSSTP